METWNKYEDGYFELEHAMLNKPLTVLGYSSW